MIERSRLEWLAAASAWLGVCVLSPPVALATAAAAALVLGWRIGRRL